MKTKEQLIDELIDLAFAEDMVTTLLCVVSRIRRWGSRGC